MDRTKTKRIQQVAVAVCLAVVVAFLAIMPMFARQPAAKTASKASILTATAATTPINTREVLGGGKLAEQAPIAVTVPKAVKLTDFVVRNGDAVTKGQPIATVDRVSVMHTISQVQDTLDYLDRQIKAAGSDRDAGTVTALAGGTVKQLFAKPGDSVRQVMLEHGALAVLSLDGLLAVEIFTDSDMRVGRPMHVTLASGKVVTGRVAGNLGGYMTVTIEDLGYTLGEDVDVATASDVYLGTGKLYIYSPWKATAHAGTVGAVHVQEGDQLRGSQTIMTLDDVGYSAAFRQLVDQRQSYEQLLQTLFRMYETEAVTAPADGLVSGIDLDSPQRLSLGIDTAPPKDGPLYSTATARIAQVTQQEAMTLTITVDEQDVLALEKGMEATVKITARGSEVLTATVTHIGNVGSNQGGSSKYPVELAMERSDGMLAGMHATAVLVLEQEEAALTVPVAALVDQDGKTLVYTGYDEKTEQLRKPVTVTVGACDGDNAIILEGLSEGQTVYYAYYNKVEASTRPDFTYTSVWDSFSFLG